MRTYRVEKQITSSGKLEIENVPFKKGEIVEVILLGHEPIERTSAKPPSLQGTVLHYSMPTEPVADGDWVVNK
jgi:hypothetical protein